MVFGESGIPLWSSELLLLLDEWDLHFHSRALDPSLAFRWLLCSSRSAQ